MSRKTVRGRTRRFEKPRSSVPTLKRQRITYVEQSYSHYEEEQSNPKYEDLSFINPTSNIAERFFSVCKQIFSVDRRRLTPDHMEMLLVLKLNRGLWSLDTLKIFPLAE